jgi:uncharacterized OB-fold protein
MTLLDAAEPDEVTGPWWEATREHRLVLQSCTACDVRQHPPRSVCLACGMTDGLGWASSHGAGVVDACTVVHRGPYPDVPVPYVVARVRLAEGPLLLTRLVDAPPDAWAVGDAVRLGWEDLPDGRALPVFHPAPHHPEPHHPTGLPGSAQERQARGLPAER